MSVSKDGCRLHFEYALRLSPEISARSIFATQQPQHQQLSKLKLAPTLQSQSQSQPLSETQSETSIPAGAAANAGIWAAFLDSLVSSDSGSNGNIGSNIKNSVSIKDAKSKDSDARVVAEGYAFLFDILKSSGSFVEAFALSTFDNLSALLSGRMDLKQALSFSSSSPPRKADVGAIKAHAWHPHKPLLAVLHRQDVVIVYNFATKSFVGKHQGMLLSSLMEDATCLEWMPKSGNTLAVGCKSGVCIWKIFLDQPSDMIHFPYAASFSPDASVMASSTHLVRPVVNIDMILATPSPRNLPPPPSQPPQQSNGAAAAPMGQPFLIYHVKHPKLERVTAIAFSPDARFLYAGCAVNPGIAVIDLAVGEVVAFLSKLTGNGTVRLSCSKDGRYLAQVCSLKFLRIWSTDTMNSVDLLAAAGPGFRDACWMPDSRTLILALDGESEVATGNVGMLSALQIAGNGAL
ncbi:hypothetical protein HK100_011917, partial [Physocladia obscura]